MSAYLPTYGKQNYITKQNNSTSYTPGAVVKAVNTYRPNYFTDPNDPLAMNSFADALLNKDAKRQRYGNWVDTPVLGDLASTVVGGVDVLFNNTIKPILGNTKYGYETDGLQGAVKSIGTGATQSIVNSLVNLGETADLLANPIKATAIEGAKALGIGDYGSKYGGNVFKGVASSVGLNGDGRQSYDWDTGNFITDLVLEIASDPTTWVTAGASSVGKELLVPGIKGAILDATELADDVATKAAKGLNKTLSRAYMNRADDLNNLLLRMFDTKNGYMSNNFVRGILTDAGVTNEQAAEVAKLIFQRAQDGTLQGVSKLVNAKKVYRFADNVDDVMLKAGLYSSGIGQALDAVKAGTKKVGKAVSPYIKELNNKPLVVYKEGLSKVLTLAEVSENKSVIDNITSQINQSGTDEKKLQAIYRTYAALSNITGDTVHKTIADVSKEVLDYGKMPTDKVTRALYQKIMPWYKTGMLSTSVGLPIRNLFDAVPKNAIDRGGLLELAGASADMKYADYLYRAYNDTTAKLADFVENSQTKLAFSLDTISDLQKKPLVVKENQKAIDSSSISKFFKQFPSELDEATYRELRKLFTDSANVVDGLTAATKREIQSFSRIQQLGDMVEKFSKKSPEAKKIFVDQVNKVSRYNTMKYSSKVYLLQEQLLTGSKKQITDVFRDMDSKYNRAFIQDAIAFSWLPVNHTAENFEKYMAELYKIDNTTTVLDFILDKSPITKLQEWIESRARIANYVEARRQGRTIGEAINSIKDTHYVYGDKAISMKVLETYFPFMAFTTNNAAHWNRLLFGKDVYSWADSIRSLFKDIPVPKQRELWEELVNDATAATKFVYKRTGKERELYDATRAAFLSKYLPTAGKIAQDDFYPFIKGFVRSQKDPYTDQARIAFMRSMHSSTRRSTPVKQFLRMWDTSSDLETLTDPELYDYQNRARNGPWTLEPDYNHIAPSQSELYRINAGNIKYGKEIQDPKDPSRTLQRVVKISPSYIDAINFGLNPVGNTLERLIAPISVPLEYLSGGSQRDAKEYISQLIPIAGVIQQRHSKTPENLAAFKSPDMLVASMFGVTKNATKFSKSNPVADVTEEMVKRWYGQHRASDSLYNPYDTYPQMSTTKSVSSGRYYNNLRSVYQSKGTGTGTSTVYRQQARVNKYARTRNLYKDLYTSTGKARLRLRMGNTSGGFSQYRIKDIQNTIRKQYHYIK